MSRSARLGIAVPAAVLLFVLAVVTLPGTAQTPPPPVPSSAPAEYLLGPLDELDITVFGEPDLTRSVVVRPDGKISLPLIGEILVAGMTTAQLAEKITAALRVYLKSPQVTVSLTKPREPEKAFVYVVGQVSRPGSYELRVGLTLMEVIAQAGGVTTRAALRKATLIRRASGESLALDLARLLVQGDQSANLALEGGDIIIIPEFLNRVLVWGVVKSPGAYDLQEGARVMDALAAAGGPADKAALDKVGVIRQTAQGTRAVVATVNISLLLSRGDQTQNVLLQHADVVYVPQSNRVSWQDILSWLSGFSLIKALFGF